MKKILLILVAVMTAVFASKSALAAQTSFHGLSISPAIQQLALDQAQSRLSYRIHLYNSIAQTISVKVTTLDFKSLNETGGLAFIANNAADIEHRYGLAKWIRVPADLIHLPAGGGKDISIKIDNRPDLTPGGHYAAILFELVAPGSSNSNHVEVDQVISSLLFVRKSGGEVYRLKLKNVVLHRSFAWFGWPTRLDTFFANTGNVQTAPRGVITIAGTNTVLNPDSSLVLPDSTRLINTDLRSIKASFWPGIYHLKLSYRPDGSNAFNTISTSYVYIGWRFLEVLTILIVALLFALPRRTRESTWLFSRMVVRRTFTRLKRLVSILAKLVWKVLIYMDTTLGRWLDARDRRKARKN